MAAVAAARSEVFIMGAAMAINIIKIRGNCHQLRALAEILVGGATHAGL